MALLITLPLLVTLPADVPVDITREDAREAAGRELAKASYQQHEPGLLRRGLDWVLDRLDDLLESIGGGYSTTGYLGLLTLIVVVVLAVVALRLKLGPFAGRPAGDGALFTGRELTADGHRAAAEAHAAEGRWAEAVRERLRAVIRELEQRGLLDRRPGRTADEAAAEAGASLPDCAAGLRESAGIFDDVWYGGRTATQAMDARLRALDESVRTARRSVCRP